MGFAEVAQRAPQKTENQKGLIVDFDFRVRVALKLVR